jgi:two-component system OmpR family sensor kinase
MSLRWRLTLLSALVMAVVVALFGTIAYFTVSFFLYRAVDDNLERQVAATLLYGYSRQTGDISQLGERDQIGTVFYTIIDTNGVVHYPSRNVFISDPMYNQAMSGRTVKSTQTLSDGTRVRVLSAPIPISDGTIIGVLQAITPLDMTDHLLNELKIFLAVAAFVLLLVAATGSYILTGRTLRAVESITRKAHQIELSQDLTQRIPSRGTDDEVGHLVDTFNQMLSRLQAAFEAQRRFIADSSHELRTPITIIKSNMHLLRRTTDPSERTELIDTTEAEVSRLNRMVNDLLYMAQMQAGHDLKPVLRHVELDSLLLDVFARTRSIAALKNQKVVLVHEDIAACIGDRDQLQHLLLNLADNATKYTPEGGTIALGLWQEGGWARLEVSDSGPGIPEEDLPHIYERFFRTPDARQTVRAGSGLGLAIVKTIAQAHGGRVEAFSKVGEGTTFRLWLRLVPESITPVPEDEPFVPKQLQEAEGPAATI